MRKQRSLKTTLNASIPVEIMQEINKKNPYDNRSRFITILLKAGLKHYKKSENFNSRWFFISLNSDNEKLALALGWKNNKRLTYGMVADCYKDTSRVRKTLKQLQIKGYIKFSGVPGIFEVVELPDVVKKEYFKDEFDKEE